MHDTNTEWQAALSALMQGGQSVSPRGIPCRELLGYQTVIPMNDPVVTIPQRKLGYKFMAAEAYWILSGDNRVATIAPYSKKIAQFSDDGKTFFGAYGPKIHEQLDYVTHKLRDDPYSRQAVINIWRENPPQTKDVPCTISVQWLIRDGKLHCIDTMRSSDIILGWPYDVFNFSMMSLWICCVLRTAYGLKLRLGNLYLTAGSLHLYESDEAVARQCIQTLYVPKSHVHHTLDYGAEHWAPGDVFLWLKGVRSSGVDFEAGLKSAP